MRTKLGHFLNRGYTHALVLACLVIILRIVLILNAPNIYFFDSYQYLEEAFNFASNGNLQFGLGLPFVLSLGLFVKILGSIGVILVSRLYGVFLSVFLILIIYSLASKVSGSTFALAAGVLAAFEPYTLIYSVVPHNDVFAVTMGFAALYLATSSKTICYLLCPVFLYMAAFTRPEFYFVFGISTIVIYFWKSLRDGLRQNVHVLLFIAICFIIPAIFLFPIVQSFTRFGLIEKFAIFLRPDLLLLTLSYIFDFYGSIVPNLVFISLVLIGTIELFRNLLLHPTIMSRLGRETHPVTNSNKDRKLKDFLKSEGGMIATCLFLVFVLEVIALTVYGYGYTIVDGELMIQPWLPQRYLILPRILTSLPLAHLILLVVRRVRTEIGRKGQ